MIVVHFNSGLFCVSGNFPETAWRAFKAVRQLMLIKPNFWVSAFNRLAVQN